MPLNVSQIDFDEIKANIIAHLRTKDDFIDYDFTGSALNTLIDALAYASHYMGIYANMNINEMFLDTAIMRSSVVSKAKELGYIPKQHTSSKATVNVSVDLTGETIPTNVIVPKNTLFNGADSDGKNYRFSVESDTTLTNDGNDVFSGDVIVVEGQTLTETWTHSTLNPLPFILSNGKVDTTTIEVNIKPFVGSTETNSKINSIQLTHLDSESDVFFVQETPQEEIEIYFGDGYLGKDIINGNVVEVTYTLSNGNKTNNIAQFVLLNDIDSISRANFTIDTVLSSFGGDNRESIASIKHIAPKLYQAQNRCVTKDDYVAIILRDNANIKSLNVWGGETETPPKYGRFFISMNTKDGSEISPIKKTEILDNLNNFNVLTIIPEIVDPQKIHINIDTVVTYKATNTSLNSDDIITKVNLNINEFFDTQLYDFADTFRYSELLSKIDSSDVSIVGNLTTITLKDTYVTVLGETSRSIVYSNAVKEKTFTSNEWTDNSSRVLKISDVLGDGYLYLTNNGVDITSHSIGTIDYITGVVNILDFDFNIANEPIVFTVEPTSYDVVSKFNTLLEQGTVNVSTNVGY